MKPGLKDVANGGTVRTAAYSQTTGTASASPEPVASPRPDRPPRSAADSRNETPSRLLSQKRGPDAVMLGALSVALLCGLIGLAVHFMWIVATS
jgi:hypothetical protein